MLKHDLLDFLKMLFLDFPDFLLVFLIYFALLVFENFLSGLVDLFFGPDGHLKVQDFPIFGLNFTIELIVFFLHEVEIVVEFTDVSLKFKGKIVWVLMVKFFFQLNDFNFSL